MNKTELLVSSIDYRTQYTVCLVDGQEILNRWEAIEGAVHAAFEGAAFSGDDKDDKIHDDKNGFLNNPLAHTRAGAKGQFGEGLGHVLAASDDEIVGGIFCVPQIRKELNGDCNMGWVFASKELPPRARVFVMDSLIDKAYTTAVTVAGFERIVVSMGTVAGANAITRRYGFIHEPTQNRSNRWIVAPESFTRAQQRRSTIHG